MTADTNLLPASQAELTLTAVAYESPNQRYIYIDPPQPNRALQVGSYANIKVYSAMPSYVPISALSYMVRERRLTVLAVPPPIPFPRRPVTRLLPSGAVQGEGGALRDSEVSLGPRQFADSELQGHAGNGAVRPTPGLLHHVQRGHVRAGGRRCLAGCQGQVCQWAPGTTSTLSLRDG